MSEFFLELFSEEVPALLQKNSRKSLLNAFQKLFEEKEITYKKSASYSTPNRLIIIFEGLNKEIIKKAEIIKGPNINAPEQALEGFLRSNQITKDQIFKKRKLISKESMYSLIKEHNIISSLLRLVLLKSEFN